MRYFPCFECNYALRTMCKYGIRFYFVGQSVLYSHSPLQNIPFAVRSPPSPSPTATTIHSLQFSVGVDTVGYFSVVPVRGYRNSVTIQSISCGVGGKGGAAIFIFYHILVQNRFKFYNLYYLRIKL